MLFVLLYTTLLSFARGVPHGSHACALQQTSTPFSAGEVQNIQSTCHCKGRNKCSNVISWNPPTFNSKHPPIKGYRLAFYKHGFQFPGYRYCFKVSNATTSFKFDQHNGFDLTKWYRYSVVPEPIKGFLIEKLQFLQCPVPLKMKNDHLPLTEIYVGGDCVFNCTYTGIPRPNIITWKFNGTTLHNNNHIRITNNERVTSLTIINAQTSHQGVYSCSISNEFSKEPETISGWLRVNQPLVQSPILKLGPIIAIVAVSFLALVSIISASIYCINRKPKAIPVSEKRDIYVSHYTTNDTDRHTLLQFVSFLQQRLPGVTFSLDLTNQNAINEAGGMSQWVPTQLTACDVILVVLSRDYLKAFDNVEQDGDGGSSPDSSNELRKFRSEYDHIQKLLFERCQVSDRLVIVSSDVSADSFPGIFRGRTHFELPKICNESVTMATKSLNDMFNVLCGTDPMKKCYENIAYSAQCDNRVDKV